MYKLIIKISLVTHLNQEPRVSLVESFLVYFFFKQTTKWCGISIIAILLFLLRFLISSTYLLSFTFTMMKHWKQFIWWNVLMETQKGLHWGIYLCVFFKKHFHTLMNCHCNPHTYTPTYILSLMTFYIVLWISKRKP